MDFIRDWQPDLILTLIFLIGGIIQIFLAPIFSTKKEVVMRWRIGGIFFTLLGVVFMAIRFI